MKRIPRSFPVDRSRRQPGDPNVAEAPPEAAVAVLVAGGECADALGPQARALLDRLRQERDLRLQRGLRSEASGIELAIRMICEAALCGEDPAHDRTR